MELIPEALQRVSTRLELKGLPHERLARDIVLDLDCEDGFFDVAFSHGVLRHMPNLRSVQGDIGRYLKPDGGLVVTMYVRLSL